MNQLILASGSQRRKDILEFLGIPFDVVISEFPEEDVHFSDFENAEDYVSTIAVGKALMVASKYPDSIILAADTSVFLGRDVYGKPKDYDDARRILKQLRGQVHEVWTGVCVLNSLNNEQYIQSVQTRVEFFPFSDEQLEQYIATGESLGKAGAYAIQYGARGFVRQIQGSLTNVIGLPIEETAELLERVGIPVNVNVREISEQHFNFSQ